MTAYEIGLNSWVYTGVWDGWPPTRLVQQIGASAGAPDMSSRVLLDLIRACPAVPVLGCDAVDVRVPTTLWTQVRAVGETETEQAHGKTNHAQ